MTSLRIAKETAVYSLVLAVSSLSLLIDFYLFENPVKLYVGLILAFVGMITGFMSFLKWGGFERPLGVTLLALSYSLGGIIVIALGGWVLTLLFLLALVSFIVSWGLLRGKTWARIATVILTCLGLILSFLGVVNDGVVYLPGILQAVFILWYLNRPHVGSYFDAESLWDFDVSRKILVPIFGISVGIAIVLANAYANPPTYTLVSDNFEAWSTGPGGGMGQLFSARRADLLTYSFQVIGGGPARLYIERSGYPYTAIISTNANLSGFGSVEVPSDGGWMVRVQSCEGNYVNVQVKLDLTQSSVRASTMQLLLLIAVCGALTLFWTLRFGRVSMNFYV